MGQHSIYRSLQRHTLSWGVGTQVARATPWTHRLHEPRYHTPEICSSLYHRLRCKPAQPLQPATKEEDKSRGLGVAGRVRHRRQGHRELCLSSVLMTTPMLNAASPSVQQLHRIASCHVSASTRENSFRRHNCKRQVSILPKLQQQRYVK